MRPYETSISSWWSAKEHMPKEQAGALLNTILQVTCSFQQEMDNMATNQVFLLSQIVPNLWGSWRGLFEGLSLLGPPSCLASWPASLVERVTAVPTCQNMPGSSQTPTKSNLPSSRSAKTTPDSGKKPTPISQTSCRVILGGQGKKKRGCGGAETGREEPEEVHRACTFFR